MSEQNKQLVRRWFEEVWNQGQETAIDELLASDAIVHGLGDTEVTLHGPDQFKPFFRNLRGAIPDVHMTVEDLVAEGDRVAVRIDVKGTHKGPQLGVPPSGNSIHIAGVIVIRAANGKLVEGWNSWDQLGLLRQIGALPAPHGPDRFVAANS